MGTYRTHRAAYPQGPAYCTYGVRVPASAVPYVPRTVAPQVDAERWRVEKRLGREAGGEAPELSASTESLPSSAAFDDSAISSEGEESEENEEAGEAGEENEEAGEAGEESEAGEGSEAGGEPQAGGAEAGRCEWGEPVRLEPKHRASLEEFTLLERACCEEPAVKGLRCEEPAVKGLRCDEPAVKGMRCEGQGSRGLSDRADGDQP